MTSQRRRGRLVAGAALLVFLAATLPVGSTAARSAPYANASTTGDAGCDVTGACQQWSAQSPAGAAAWTFDQTKTHVGTGTASTASAKLSFTEIDDAQGQLGALTITGTVKIEVTSAGKANSMAGFSADFVTSATTLQIVGTVATDADGTDSIGSGSGAHIQLDCGPMDVTSTASAGYEFPSAHDSQSLTREVAVLSEGGNGTGECSLHASIAVRGGSDRGGGGAQHTSATAAISMTILAGGPGPSASAAPCDLSGIVRDGTLAADGHANPLVGIEVSTRQGNRPPGRAVTTDGDGRYCIPAGTVDPSGDAPTIEAALIDAGDGASLFRTLHMPQSDPVALEQTVDLSNLGRTDVDVSFTATADRPWLGDVANIHWRSKQFVDWLFDDLLIDPAVVPPFRIWTATSSGTQYDPSTQTVEIDQGDTAFGSRSVPYADGPENDEWHEIGHHVSGALGIAPDTAEACAHRMDHQGWLNNSTCDSLDEGFSIFIATLASLDIDATSGPGYATPQYNRMVNLEGNGYRPDSVEIGVTSLLYREDFAVAQLLWDLRDPTPDEKLNVPINERGVTDTEDRVRQVPETIAVPGPELVRLLSTIKPATIVDLFQALRDDSVLPPDALATSIDVNGDGTPDVSPLEAEFIGHGFYGWQLHLNTSAYRPGDPIAFSQPGVNNLVVRRQIDPVPGSAVRIVNPNNATVRVSIEEVEPSTSDRIDVTVGPTSELLIHVEVPPYWRGQLPADRKLPACPSQDPMPVTVVITSGAQQRTVTSCEFLQTLATSTGEAVLTFEVDKSVAPTIPAAAIAVALGIAALGLVLGLVLMRRRQPA